MLLLAGAAVDARYGRGRRPALMYAVERDEQRVIAALLLGVATIGPIRRDGRPA
ncbi:hypothetical protein [Micromonospora sp. KC606]|uniref:hypothetical protein n=1 Tax=Micromonospora sp. KC606 TaxID=2530379 RepID=UPI001404C567|nr:hypothetical protein [Micromonospora sp. KC606]